jgi:hypothetical protein
VVIVDEAQDLSESNWLLVEALAGEGMLWAFHDPAQAFHHATHISSQLWPFPARVSWYTPDMGKDLTDTERAIIQQVIFGRWNPLRLRTRKNRHDL